MLPRGPMPFGACNADGPRARCTVREMDRGQSAPSWAGSMTLQVRPRPSVT